MAKYTAICQCGNVAISVDGTIDSGMACNCSMCARRASLLWFVPRTQVTFVTPDSAAAVYEFNRHTIRHRFCGRCGIHVYGEANGRDGTPTVAVNLRCVQDLDLDKVPVTHFDGKAM